MAAASLGATRCAGYECPVFPLVRGMTGVGDVRNRRSARARTSSGGRAGDVEACHELAIGQPRGGELFGALVELELGIDKFGFQ